MLVAVTIGLFGAGAPAHGDSDELDYWVQWADNQNQVILNEFTNAALSACTMAELNSARATADSKLDVVWNTANSQINLLEAADPELALDAAGARAELQSDHDEAHAEVAATYTAKSAAMGSCATTTTTTPPGTTTTTSAPTTTSSTTTTVPRSTTTSSTTTTSTTTTTEPPTTTTTTQPAAVFVGEPPAEQGGTAIRPDEAASGRPAMADPVIGDDDAMTSALVFDADGAIMNDGMGDSVAEGMAHTGTVSAMFTAGASVVLPPGLVQKAVGPIIAMEFLVRTLIASLGTMIVPLTVFLMAAGIVVWRESRRSAPITG
ncbi:MAG TPA: hypothetical protein VLA29_11575 [Acidimicrobiia bacterium]|nr:hypothetical protein [Acidimicrobiia bacterium]